ncbi:hypothetical protein BGZ75_004576, partial [Mortierella antarctica]
LQHPHGCQLVPLLRKAYPWPQRRLLLQRLLATGHPQGCRWLLAGNQGAPALEAQNSRFRQSELPFLYLWLVPTRARMLRRCRHQDRPGCLYAWPNSQNASHTAHGPYL